MPNGTGYLKKDIDSQSLSAKQILFSARHLRDHVENNEPHNAALEMMRLLFAGFNMSGFELMVSGVRLKTGQKKGGGKTADYEGFFGAINKVLAESPNISRENLWRRLKKYNETVPLDVGDYEIYFREDVTGNEEGNRL